MDRLEAVTNSGVVGCSEITSGFRLKKTDVLASVIFFTPGGKFIYPHENENYAGGKIIRPGGKIIRHILRRKGEKKMKTLKNTNNFTPSQNQKINTGGHPNLAGLPSTTRLAFH